MAIAITKLIQLLFQSVFGIDKIVKMKQISSSSQAIPLNNLPVLVM